MRDLCGYIEAHKQMQTGKKNKIFNVWYNRIYIDEILYKLFLFSYLFKTA